MDAMALIPQSSTSSAQQLPRLLHRLLPILLFLFLAPAAHGSSGGGGGGRIGSASGGGGGGNGVGVPCFKRGIGSGSGGNSSTLSPCVRATTDDNLSM